MKLCKKLNIIVDENYENFNYPIFQIKVNGFYYNNVGPSYLCFFRSNSKFYLEAAFFIKNDFYETNKVSGFELYDSRCLTIKWLEGRYSTAVPYKVPYKRKTLFKDGRLISCFNKEEVEQIIEALSSTESFVKFLIENKKFNLVKPNYSSWIKLLNEALFLNENL